MSKALGAMSRPETTPEEEEEELIFCSLLACYACCSRKKKIFVYLRATNPGNPIPGAGPGAPQPKKLFLIKKK